MLVNSDKLEDINFLKYRFPDDLALDRGFYMPYYIVDKDLTYLHV